MRYASLLLAFAPLALFGQSTPPGGGGGGGTIGGPLWLVEVEYEGMDTAKCVVWDYDFNAHVTMTIQRPWGADYIIIDGEQQPPGLEVPAGAWRSGPPSLSPSTISYRSEGVATVKVKWNHSSPAPQSADFFLSTGASYFSQFYPLRTYELETGLDLTPVKTAYEGSIPGVDLKTVEIDENGEGEFEIDLHAFIDSHRHQGEAIYASAQSLSVIKDGRGAVIYGMGAGVPPKRKSANHQQKIHVEILGGLYTPLTHSWYYQAYDPEDAPVIDQGNNTNYAEWEVGLPTQIWTGGGIGPMSNLRAQWASSNPYITNQSHGLFDMIFGGQFQSAPLPADTFITRHLDSLFAAPFLFFDGQANYQYTGAGATGSTTQARLTMDYFHPVAATHKSIRDVKLMKEFVANTQGINAQLWQPSSHVRWANEEYGYKQVYAMGHGAWVPTGHDSATFSDNAALDKIVAGFGVGVVVLDIASAFSPEPRVAAGLAAAKNGIEALVDNYVQTVTRPLNRTHQPAQGLIIEVIGGPSEEAHFAANPFIFEWSVQVRPGTWYRAVPLDEWSLQGFVGTKAYTETYNEQWYESPRKYLFKRSGIFPPPGGGGPGNPGGPGAPGGSD